MQLKWNLNDILRVDKFYELYREIESDLRHIEKLWAGLKPEMKSADFAKFIKFDEKLTEKIARLYDLPHLMESADEKSAKAKLLKERAKDLYVRASQETQKIQNWLKGLDVKGKKRLDDKNAKRLFSSVPDLEYVLNYSRESARHTLSEEIENLITEKEATGEQVLVSLRELLETELTFELRHRGKAKEINNRAEIVKLTREHDASLRKSAYEAMLEPYKANIDKFFMIYQAVAKAWGANAKRRGFKSAISMRNHRNHLSDLPIEIMLQVSKDNRQIFQKYFKFKAKELGLKKLTRFDIYAPLEKTRENVPLEKAIDIVLETFNEFSPRFAKYAKSIIDANHIDYLPNPTKRDGAFCATVGPKIKPYILLNYAHTFRDVETLAHELGHGVHSLYASHHSISAQHANLPLAETASTLGELILFEKLLARAASAKAKKIMLSEKISDSYATIIRQNYFVQFELDAHNAFKQGITPEALSDIYLSGLQEQYGKSVKVDPIFKYEWASIPHIVNSPFYCYAYNFGELLSLALFKKYKEEGKSFVPKIEKILEYGGSENPAKVLREVGVDINSRSFWQGSFEIIRRWQKEFEKL